MALLARDFCNEILPILLRRFDFTYFQEDTCTEYFITKTGTKEQISQAIVFSLSRPSHQINVSRFYPELYKQERSKYLSAACFYFLAHHFARLYGLPKDYRICLESPPDIFENFYSKLRDFYLHMEWIELCKTAHVCGKYPDLKLDTSKIKQKCLDGKQILFLI